MARKQGTKPMKPLFVDLQAQEPDIKEIQGDKEKESPYLEVKEMREKSLSNDDFKLKKTTSSNTKMNPTSNCNEKIGN